jgi:hypothetical protein
MSADLQDYQTAKGYYDRAKQCMDEGQSSQACKDLQDEGFRRGMEAAGVDPAITDAALECARSGDSEVCAKAAAKVAAVYGCTAATGGGGAYLCSKLAPIVVDKIWPVVGPPLVAAWDLQLGVLDGVVDMLGGIISDLGDLLGFGGNDDGPSHTEILTAMYQQGYSIVRESIQASETAVVQADVESRKELGLPIELHGGVGVPTLTVQATPAVYDRTDLAMPKIDLTKRLLAHPGFGGPIYVLVQASKTSFKPSEFRFVDADYAPGLGEMVIWSQGAKDIENNWTIDSQPLPSGFYIKRGAVVATNYDDVRTAYGMILERRTAAVRDAASQTVGDVVAQNITTARSRQLDPSLIKRKEPESNWWLWALGLAGAAGVAYWQRDKIKKWMK